MDFLILHGHGGRAGIHWQQWLHDELVSLGHRIEMPTLPNAEDPDRLEWLEAAQVAATKLNSAELVVVGHSIGATTGLDFIELSPTPIKGFISVSGFYCDYAAELNTAFMAAREIDLAKVQENTGGVSVFFGDDDPYVPQKVLADLAAGLEVTPTVISSGGHLNTDAGFTKFPGVLESALAFS